ncbi:GAF domain-containing protein [Alteromonas sp. ASW11-36]|uniref:GAF domain-containing protein n=1 Tax=Alteromonas arenosi TaxID=3055817 RepID=A0ABT7SYX4_9ALTE|nr:GAF domain-containing protein [Alteromonas sp. ASW11-36]MDM7861380.1 GAF domain-containing protein [Alteromonas sp. ASW11-36]
MDIDSLTQLGMSLSKPDVQGAEKLRLTCSAIADSIPHADRVSLWEFFDSKTAIRCIALLTKEGFSVPNELILRESDFPEYFAAILKEDTVCASNARSDPRTQCFNQGYFEPNDIHSLLDYIFSREFVQYGIICCESVNRQVEWSDNDIENLKRAATVVSVYSYVEML